MVLQVKGWGMQPDLTGNPSMTTQPLARYGARNGALASGLTTSVTPRPGTRPEAILRLVGVTRSGISRQLSFRDRLAPVSHRIQNVA